MPESIFVKFRIPAFLFVVLLPAWSCVYHDVSHPIDCASVIQEAVFDEVVNASVCGATDGKIVMHVTGGVEPYQYSIGDGASQSTGTFNGLSSGLYAITVADQNGCQLVYDSILIGVEHFSVDLATTPDTDCITGNGVVAITVNENTGPYQYSVDGGAFTASNRLEGLRYGDHILNITDAEGCGVRTGVTIPRGATGVSWQNDILPIMQTSCAITGCHNGISRNNDWRLYAQVKTNAAEIRKRTQNKSMPFDTGMSQANIDLIACWVDEGAKEN